MVNAKQISSLIGLCLVRIKNGSNGHRSAKSECLNFTDHSQNCLLSEILVLMAKFIEFTLSISSVSKAEMVVLMLLASFGSVLPPDFERHNYALWDNENFFQMVKKRYFSYSGFVSVSSERM